MTIVDDKQIVPENLARDIPFFITWNAEATVDVATSQAFKFIRVENDGNLLIEGAYGENIYIPAATSGEWIPVVGVKILSSGTVEGHTGSVSTTATGIWVYGGM